MRILAIFLFLFVWNKGGIATTTMLNILMFVIDDLGWNDTSYKGSDIITPTGKPRNPSAAVLRAKTVFPL